jgi:hypothetical protein
MEKISAVKVVSLIFLPVESCARYPAMAPGVRMAVNRGHGKPDVSYTSVQFSFHGALGGTEPG